MFKKKSPKIKKQAKRRNYKKKNKTNGQMFQTNKCKGKVKYTMMSHTMHNKNKKKIKT